MNRNKCSAFGLCLLITLVPCVLFAQRDAPEQPFHPGTFQDRGDPANSGKFKPRQGFGHDMGLGHDMGGGLIAKLLNNEKLAKELEITESQRASLEAKMASQASQRDALLKQLKEAAMVQAKLLTEADVDEAAVMAAVEKTGAVRTELAKLEVRSLISCRNTLTPDQLSKIRAHMQNRRPDKQHRDNTDRSRSPHDQRRRGHGGPPNSDVPPGDADTDE